MGWQVGFSTEEITDRTADVGRVDPALKLAAGLHDLPAGVVHRGAAMETGSHQRESIGDLGVTREDLRDLYAGRFGGNRFERAADFRRGIGFHIESVELTRRAEIENHDGRTFGFRRVDRSGFARREILRKSETDRAQRSDLQKIAPRHAVAGLCRTVADQVQHGNVPRLVSREVFNRIIRDDYSLVGLGLLIDDPVEIEILSAADHSEYSSNFLERSR